MVIANRYNHRVLFILARFSALDHGFSIIYDLLDPPFLLSQGLLIHIRLLQIATILIHPTIEIGRSLFIQHKIVNFFVAGCWHSVACFRRHNR